MARLFGRAFSGNFQWLVTNLHSLCLQSPVSESRLRK